MTIAPGADGSTDATKNLLNFNLTDLAPYTLEKMYSADASSDFHLFFVGRDDVHSILIHLISRARESLYLNMFGYDDAELNALIMTKVVDPNVVVIITLDKSQRGGKREKLLLDADKKQALSAFNTHFVIGSSATHQISHTKGFVVDSRVGAEGSTNWSTSGEGTFVRPGRPGGPGYKAQNNTQTVFVDPDSVARFQQELVNEHLLARDDLTATGNPVARRQNRLKFDAVATIRATGKAHPSAR